MIAPGRNYLWHLVAGLALVAAIPLALAFGAVRVDPVHLFAILSGRGGGDEALIILRLRLPRVLMAAIVGGGLSAAGMALQSVFRNPMAEPYVMGVSSGAALGAVVAIYLGAGSLGGFLSSSLIQVFAFAGAMTLAMLAFFVSGRSIGTDTNTLLLSGLCLSTLAQGILSTVILLNRDYLERIYFWSLGSFASSDWSHFTGTLGQIVVGVFALLVLGRQLDLLSLGTDAAASMGSNVARDRTLILAIACFIASSCVAASGIISFVGLIGPQIARLLTGASHRRSMSLAIMIGALLMILADLAARVIAPPRELPLSIFTAIIGVPVFLGLMRKRSLRV